VNVATPPAGGGASGYPGAGGHHGAGEHPIPPPPADEACPLCGAPLAPEQEWCLRCGAAARTRLAASPAWKAPAIALAVVVALSLGVLAAALVKLAGGSGHTATTARTITVTTPAATPTATIPTATVPTATTPATPGAGAGAGSTLSPGRSTTTAPGAKSSTGVSGVSTPETATGLATPTTATPRTTPQATAPTSTKASEAPSSNPLVAPESPKK
jgi:hypothetical protein